MVTRGYLRGFIRYLVLVIIAVLTIVGTACDLLEPVSTFVPQAEPTPVDTAPGGQTSAATPEPLEQIPTTAPTVAREPISPPEPEAITNPTPAMLPGQDPPPVPAQAPAPADLAGTWISPQWGEMDLVQKGKEVSGEYTWDDGEIEGSILGDRLEFDWSESPSYAAPGDAGDGHLIVTADGQTMAGEWRYGYEGPWSGTWTAERSTSASPAQPVAAVPSPTAAPPPTQAPATADLSGVWMSAQWGEMNLGQIGIEVTGTYTWDEGKLVGTVSGDRFDFQWSEAPSYAAPGDAGDGYLIVTVDGKSMSGEWRYGYDGEWSGTWTADRSATVAALPEPVGSAGIFIEAEDESDSRLSGGTVTRKEIGVSANRPNPSGGSDWVLYRQGESLSYEFEVAAAGDYVLWVRDFSDNMHPPGARTIGITIDGQFLGTFPENTIRAAYPPGVFVRQSTATVHLVSGQHVMEVEKTASTSAAALLDAFYLTSDPTDSPVTIISP